MLETTNTAFHSKQSTVNICKIPSCTHLHFSHTFRL